MVRLRSADLIARDIELGELRAAVVASRAGQPAAVVVCGPAGVGKTRLVGEAVRRFGDAGDLVLVGHCVNLYGEEIPYAAAAEVLRHLVRERGAAGTRRLLGPAVDALSMLVPDLAPEAEDDRAARSSGGDGPSLHVLDAFITGLDHAAEATRGLVWLWMEDLQWADRATRTLVSYLLRVDRPANLLVTATVRTEDPASPGAGDVVGELLRIPGVDQVEVSPFTRLQVGEHLHALTGARSGPAVVEAVASLSGGLPFYTELWAREGLPDGRVPTAVGSMIRGEVEGLKGDARTLVEAASVEAGRLPHDLLVAVGGTGTDGLAGIAAAVEASVLVPEADGSGYRFRHALLRESIEAGLLPVDRRRWHTRWAEQLEAAAESTDDAFARIAAAHHWAEAGDNTRAFDAVMAGAALAGQVAADAEAAGLLTRALQLWPSVPDAAERAGFDHDAVFRAALVWADQAARSDLGETLAAVRATGEQNPVRDLSVAFRRTEADGVAWLPTADEVDLLQACPLSNPWLPRAAAEASLRLQDTDPESALRLSARAVQAAELAADSFRTSSGDRTALAWMTPEEEWLYAQHARAQALTRVAGNPEEAARLYRAMGPRGEAVSPHLAVRCDAFLAEALGALGHHRDALATATAALASLPRPRQSPGLYNGLMHLAAVLEIARGDWDHALSRLDEARRNVNDDDEAYEHLALAGLVHCWRGNLETARRYATLSRSMLDAPDSKWWGNSWETVWLEAELAAARPDPSRVRSALRPLWAVPHPETDSLVLWRPLMTAVRVSVDEIAGNPARSTKQARDDLATCQVVAAKLHRIGDDGTAWDLHLTAELSRLDGSADPTPWVAAAEAWVAAGWLRERALALLGLAVAHIRTGADQDARDTLDLVRDIAHRLAATPLMAAADDIARHAGLGSTGRTGRSSSGLTAREHDVLALLAHGYSNDRIATELFISPKTVSVHVSNILTKLHASSRTEAAAIAQRSNLLSAG